MGGDHLPIEITIEAQPYRNTHSNPVRYKFDQTDRKVFKSIVEVVLTSGDVPKLKSAQDVDKYADFIVTAISTMTYRGNFSKHSIAPEIGNPSCTQTCLAVFGLGINKQTQTTLLVGLS